MRESDDELRLFSSLVVSEFKKRNEVQKEGNGRIHMVLCALGLLGLLTHLHP